LIYLSFIFSIVAIGIAISSLIIEWKEFLFVQETNSPPEIVVCLRSFSYEKGPEYDLGRSIVPIGEISFDLVNKGNIEATVHRVDVFPFGKTDDGKKSSMWFELEVQKTVVGKGISTVEEFSFEERRQYKTGWVEELEGVEVEAFWPNDKGPRLTCHLDIVSVEEGDWSCGYPRDGGLLIENECR